MSSVLRNVVTKSMPVVQNTITKRSFKAGPPRYPMPVREQIAYMVVAAVVVFSPGAYVMTHINQWRDRNDGITRD